MTSYDWVSIVLSSIALFFFVQHAIYAGREYQRYHDERAARSLLIAVLLLVATIGTLIASLGLVADDWALRAAGVSIVRGCLLVGGIVLLLMDREHKTL